MNVLSKKGVCRLNSTMIVWNDGSFVITACSTVSFNSFAGNLHAISAKITAVWYAEFG